MANTTLKDAGKSDRSTKKKNAHCKKSFPNKNRLTEDLQSKYDQIDVDSIKTFSDFPLSHETQKGLRQHGYTTPTQIQKQAIGLALNGKDVLGAAQTGSGKTLAFLIPVLEKLYCEKWNRIYGVGAIIITPTRELAKQIFQTLLEIGKYHDFSGGLIIGGKDRKFEVKRMDQCNIIICTPGRLLDHMDKNHLFDCSNMQILVLDEADRCMDMGFEVQMNQIIENLPPMKQTLLFSATQTKSVKDLARLSLKDPSYVSVHEHLEYSTPQGLKQSYIVCELKDKLSVVWSFIRHHLKQKIIIFFSSCKQVKYVFEIFSKLRPGTSLMALYGTLHQLRRMDIYDSFTKKTSGILIATDLAARGLDFPGVHWVVQADCPEDPTTYIHRVGRTARYHKGGEALLLLLPTEINMVDQLKKQKIPIEKIEMNPLKLINPVKKIEAYLSSNDTLKDSAQRAFLSYIKAIALMKDKTVFNVDALDVETFAYSLGLIKPPRIRFLQRRKSRVTNKISNVESSNKLFNSEDMCSYDDKKLSTRCLQEEQAQHENTQDDGDDFLEIKREDHNIDLPTSTKLIDFEVSQKSKKSKPKSQAAIINKMLKITGMPNKKITFTDQDDPQSNEVKQMTTNTVSSAGKRSNMALEYENENVGGIDLEKAKDVLREEDVFDKQLFKEKVKAKHKEEKRKLKEALNKNKNDDFDDECSEDEGEAPDLSWLPDPDRVYGSDTEIDIDKPMNKYDEDTKDNLTLSRSTNRPNKRKQGRDNEVKTKSKRKKTLFENINKDLSIQETEELAMLLLRDQV